MLQHIVTYNSQVFPHTLVGGVAEEADDLAAGGEVMA
jgi:hypothetical protein